MPWYERHIARYDGVQGGEPVITGTRTPVRTIAGLFHEVYDGDVDAVHAELPHLTREQVLAGLAYYDDHRVEVDADVERHAEALREFLLAQ